MAIGLFGVIFLGLFGISRLINEYSNGGERYDGNRDVVGFVRIKGGIFDATSTVRSLTKLRRNPVEDFTTFDHFEGEPLLLPGT